jgi:Holliday junction resolvasome RuvABC endonuclease subunit
MIKAKQIVNGVIGIDPSLRGTGFAFGLKESEYNVIHFSKGSDPALDLCQISDQMEKIIVENNIKYSFKEGYCYNYINAGMTRIMEVGGILKRLFVIHNVQYIDVAALTVKKVLTGIGKGKKEGVQRVVNSLLHTTIEDDNITDAIGLYLVGQGYLML